MSVANEPWEGEQSNPCKMRPAGAQENRGLVANLEAASAFVRPFRALIYELCNAVSQGSFAYAHSPWANVFCLFKAMNPHARRLAHPRLRFNISQGIECTYPNLKDYFMQATLLGNRA